MKNRKRKNGFTLLEMLVALIVFLSVSGIVASGMIQMMNTQGTIANRTEMHTSVRSATELLQQEIGQSGKITLAPVTLTGPITVTAPPQQLTVVVSSTVNMFNGMLLDIDTGQNFEVVTVNTVNSGTSITATFNKSHVGPIIPGQVSGSFGTGIVPPAAAPASYPKGSDGTHLKLYGDINGDAANPVLYVEYSCVQGTPAAPGALYRQEVLPGGVKANPPTAAMVLLNNVIGNPDGSGCFSYQTQFASDASGVNYFVTDVAVTLTVQTQNQDPQTHKLQQETKALLNITPRNVFYVWELDSYNGAYGVPRNQPMPAYISALL